MEKSQENLEISTEKYTWKVLRSSDFKKSVKGIKQYDIKNWKYLS
jgi:hypothetical protein